MRSQIRLVFAHEDGGADGTVVIRRGAGRETVLELRAHGAGGLAEGAPRADGGLLALTEYLLGGFGVGALEIVRRHEPAASG